MTQRDGLHVARRFAKRIRAESLPILGVFLFGSFAKGTPRDDSDIDIAILCRPFQVGRHEENMHFRQLRYDIDLRISPISLHPEDMENPYFGLAQEVKKHGVAV